MIQPTQLHSADDQTTSDDSSRFGRFVLLELLGEDNQGQLYRAIHQRLRKQVALKLLHTRHDDDDRSREQSLSKFRALCELSHANLLRVETAGEHNGTQYLVMEFVPGFDLQSVVDKVGPLAIADACQLIGQAGIGLGYLHNHQLTHGHIGPKSLVLTPSSRLKLVGLERAGHSESQHQFAHDLRRLATVFCSLVGCPVERILDELPIGLAHAVQLLISTDAEYDNETSRRFIDVFAKFSDGCDITHLLRRLDVTPEPGSDDDAMPGTSGYLHALYSQVDEPAVQHRRKVFIPSLVVAAILIVCTALAGSQWWTFTNPVLDPRSRGRVELSGSETVPAKSIRASSIEDPGWAAPATSPTSDDLHKSTVRSNQLLATLDPDRDAFNIQVRSTDQGTEFENLESRGIVQFPVIMPERYALQYTVERLEGDGSFGFGFSAGEGRMLALIDHQVNKRWQSGIFSVTSDGKNKIFAPCTEQILTTGVPVRLTLDVSPEHVELMRIRDPEADLATMKISHWTKSNDALSSTLPSLGKTDAYYQQAFFVHTFRGFFRISDLQILGSSADPVPQPLHGSEASSESRLAQRIVWRGGHVEIITDTGTRTVHRLQELTDNPWLVGVEKCPSATRLMIGDAELSELTKINGIRKLDLTHSQVTAEGISDVAGLQSLVMLALPRHGINGSVLALLSDLPALRQLQLIGVSLDDDDVDELARLPKLTSLCLSGCPITDTGVAKVTRVLPELEHLCLSGTKITGDCLPELAALRSLKDLQLHQTAVDDDAIADLPLLPQLQNLTLKESKVSSMAIDKLRQERPGLEIK